jgi:V/A-type H+/Na+-transporting ATPase subunit I
VAIEKMTKLDMIGHAEELNRVCRSIVLSKVLHPTNALEELNNIDFTSDTDEDTKDAVDISYLKLYSEQINYSDGEKIIKNLKQKCLLSDKPVIDEDELILDYDELMEKITEINNKFLPIYKELDVVNKSKESIDRYMKNFSWLKTINIPFEDVLGLKNFYFEIFRVSKENMLKLKDNYENIPSIIINAFEDKEYNMVMVFTPVNLKSEADKILKSLNCELLTLDEGFNGTPYEIIRSLEKKLNEIKENIKVLNDKMKSISMESSRTVYLLEKSLELEMKTSVIKSRAVCTNEFFYLSGWIPESLKKDFLNEINVYEDKLILISRNADEVKNCKSIPPTRLRNNFIVRPFETMVEMYGTPTYKEMDPTTFFALSYMVLFGAMFGDVGQGLVFFATGLFLEYKMKKPNIGGVITRLGVFSSLFGLAYGSFFGFENVIPALVIRPMENIIDVLIYAVVFGCGLLILGFVNSIVNSLKNEDIENGWFGKNGAAGLVFYVGILALVYTKVKNIPTMPLGVWIMIFTILFILMLLKQPIASLVLRKRPLFHEDKNDYFIEGGFGFVELILSMLSNTISFIRVGAFALNHVGLFVAFDTLAKMTHNGVGSASMYILGNVIIIGLEGLIVFIQSLRLEYYELFSKYYSGAGTVFEPIRLTEDLTLDAEKSVLKKINKKFILEK